MGWSEFENALDINKIRRFLVIDENLTSLVAKKPTLSTLQLLDIQVNFPQEKLNAIGGKAHIGKIFIQYGTGRE